MFASFLSVVEPACRGSVRLLFVGLLGSSACAAVYPEISSPTRPPPSSWSPEPEPPEDVLYVDFERAVIPKQTRDGRDWSKTGSKGPDAFAKVIVNGRDILVTPIESGSLHPTWPRQRRANYRIPRGAEVRIELWDAKAIQDRPICLKGLASIHDEVSPAPVELVCEESGARILVNIQPARAVLGLGLYYELQDAGRVRVTRVIQESPAGRAGLISGTQILLLQGRPVQELDALDVKSSINANARTGIDLEVLLPDGGRKSLTLKEEAMYPLVSEDVKLLP